MAINSALSGMNSAAYQMLSAAGSISSGNLDDLSSKVASMEMAKIQFAASAKVAEVQNKTIGAAIDMFV